VTGNLIEFLAKYVYHYIYIDTCSRQNDAGVTQISVIGGKADICFHVGADRVSDPA
jgi:hypothetical protein